MWPLPEPVCPTDDPGWDPPTLVRLALDHGLDRPAPHPPPRQAWPWGTSRTVLVTDGVE